MLDAIIELFGELFLEGAGEAIHSKRVPLWLRLLLILLLCGALITISILGAVSAYRATGIIGSLVCVAIALGLFFLMLFLCRKVIRNR